jgi:hypothetical protein
MEVLPSGRRGSVGTDLDRRRRGGAGPAMASEAPTQPAAELFEAGLAPSSSTVTGA